MSTASPSHKAPYPVNVLELADELVREHVIVEEQTFLLDRPEEGEKLSPQPPPGVAPFGLSFGAFDFVVTPEGRWVFLECNPAGQYGWLEGHTGLPITEAVAGTLAAAGGARGRSPASPDQRVPSQSKAAT